MNLIGYSDSEGSDDDAPQVPKPAAKPAPKPSFQKVIDRSQPGKIKLNLPAPTQKKTADDIEADAPPAKKQRTGGGAFGGFNAMLPAPKKAAATATAPAATETDEEGAILAGKRGVGRALGSGVNLRTGAEPAFKREPRLIDDEETGAPKSNNDFRASLNLPPPKTDVKLSPSPMAEGSKTKGQKAGTDDKPAKKPVRFMPLSVARGKKKRPVVAAAPIPVPSEAKPASGQAIVEPKPPARPKVSLFGTAQPEQAPVSASASNGEYKPLLHGQEEDEDDAQLPEEAFDQANSYQRQSHQDSRAAPTGAQNLTTIASELNLSESERRQLLGRRGRGEDLSGVNIVDFSIDREYAHNEQVRQQGETVQHNALKSISGTGKNSLRSLINVAVTQKDALEDHFAQGKKNKREAGSKYGW